MHFFTDDGVNAFGNLFWVNSTFQAPSIVRQRARSVAYRVVQRFFNSFAVSYRLPPLTTV